MKKITLLMLVSISTMGFSFPKLGISKTSVLDEEIVVEAESGFVYRGATIQECSSCSNASRMGDIGGPSNESGYFTVVLSVPTAGIYTMAFDFTSGEDRSIFISPNGGDAIESVVNSGDWDVVATASIEIMLQAGTNTIKFFNYNWYAPNIDKFTLNLLTAAPCETCFGPFEAEDGVVVAPATIQECETCSGGEHVGDMGTSTTDRFYTQDVEITTAGNYKMYLSFSSGDPRNIFVTVNDGTPIEASCHSIDWGVVFVKEIEMSLTEGTNTFKFFNPNDWAPNIDKFRLELLEALSVDSNELSLLSVFPNPTKNQWTIKNQNSHNLIIELYDVSGKKVSTYQSNNSNILIDASLLENGIYFAKINIENESKTLKLIKN